MPKSKTTIDPNLEILLTDADSTDVVREIQRLASEEAAENIWRTAAKENSPGEFLQKVLGHLVAQAEKASATESDEPHVPGLPKDIADAGFRLHAKADTRFVGRDPVTQELVHRTELYAYILARETDGRTEFFDTWGQQRSQAHLTLGTLDVEKLANVARAIVSTERHQAEVAAKQEQERIERESVVHEWPPADGTSQQSRNAKVHPNIKTTSC